MWGDRFFLLCNCLLVFAAVVSCEERACVSPSALKVYLNDPENGLMQRSQGDGTRITLRYRPSELVIAQEVKSMNYTPEKIDSIRKKYENIHYFIMELSRNGRQIESDYAINPPKLQSVIQHLSYGIGSDIMLVTEQRDTVFVLDHVYERTYGATHISKLLLAFEHRMVEKDGTWSILFNDQLLGLGYQRFEFDVEDIKNIPCVN